MIAPGSVKSIAEHWDLLWFIVVILIGVLVTELRIAFHKMCKKQDKLIDLHNQLPEKYVALKEFEELKEDRIKRWDKYFFPHTHYPEETGGGVKIMRNPESMKLEKG